VDAPMIRVETDISLGITDGQPAQRVTAMVVVVVMGGRPAGPPQSTTAVDERLCAGLATAGCHGLGDRQTRSVITYVTRT